MLEPISWYSKNDHPASPPRIQPQWLTHFTFVREGAGGAQGCSVVGLTSPAPTACGGGLRQVIVAEGASSSSPTASSTHHYTGSIGCGAYQTRTVKDRQTDKQANTCTKCHASQDQRYFLHNYILTIHLLVVWIFTLKLQQ